MKHEFSWHIFEISSNLKFHENPSSWSRVVPCGRTDTTKLKVAFRNFANAPKNSTNLTVKKRYQSSWLKVVVFDLCFITPGFYLRKSTIWLIMSRFFLSKSDFFYLLFAGVEGCCTWSHSMTHTAHTSHTHTTHTPHTHTHHTHTHTHTQ
jgi:hypothetical protein